jgi:hypothetical protein
MYYVHMEYYATGIEKLSKSAVTAAVKAAWLAVGKRWRRQFLPIHFSYIGFRKYKYTERSWQYDQQKLRFLHHRRPLEFSGEGKKLALYQENIHVTRYGVIVRLPRKFNWRHKKSPVRMADEIRATLPAELEDLAKHFIKVLEHEFRRRGAEGAWISQARPFAGAA